MRRVGPAGKLLVSRPVCKSSGAADPSIAPLNIGTSTKVAEMLMLYALFKNNGTGPHGHVFVHNVDKVVSPWGNGAVERNLFWAGKDKGTWGNRFLNPPC